MLLMVLNLGAGAAVTGHSGRPAGIALAGPVEAEIEVIGHRFWWEIRYLREGFVTANELHIQVGRPSPSTPEGNVGVADSHLVLIRLEPAATGRRPGGRTGRA